MYWLQSEIWYRLRENLFTCGKTQEQPAFAIAVQLDAGIHQMDVTTAFLNKRLEKEIYVKQPFEML